MLTTYMSARCNLTVDENSTKRKSHFFVLLPSSHFANTQFSILLPKFMVIPPFIAFIINLVYNIY